MSRSRKELASIELSCCFTAMPNQIFRALTSQNELRKWWAPRVVMSRNTVSQQANQDVQMKLISSEKNRSVRYSWRPEVWDSRFPNSTITFTIRDLGISRQDTGEGLILEVIHDGWIDQKERDQQEKIWQLALKSLKSLLENKKVTPWWEGQPDTTTLHQVGLQTLKQFFENHKKKKTNRNDRRIYQGLWHICSSLNPHGKWFIDEEKQSFTFKCQNQNLFRISSENILLFWEELKGIPASYLEGFKGRLSVEQDIDVEPNAGQTSLPVVSLQAEIWIAWCMDLIEEIEAAQHLA